MKKEKRLVNVMTKRKGSLESFLEEREYNISEKRNKFLCIYYSTLKNLRDDTFAAEMTYSINEQFEYPLDESVVKNIIRDVDRKEGYKFSDAKIIEMLGILEEEAELLKIGLGVKEKQERSRRVFNKFVLQEDIIERYQNGETISQIANSISCYSKRSIERLLEPYAKKRKQERNKNILSLHARKISISEIARICDCTRPTVRSVLSGKKPTNLFETENKGLQNGEKDFADACSEGLLSLYKRIIRASTPDSFNQALEDFQNAKGNVFLFGAAGSAKSSLIRRFLENLSQEERKHTCVVSMTGKAALEIGASTIHSEFKLPIRPIAPKEDIEIPKHLLSMRKLIIDEISLVRLDVFECLMRTIAKIETLQQAKVQIYLVGDFSQLGPTITSEDEKILKRYFPNSKGFYAYHSSWWKRMHFQKIHLTYIFRQDDPEFLEHLTDIKYGKFSTIDWFNTYSACFPRANAIYVCAKNKDVELYNKRAIERFPEDEIITFDAVLHNVANNDELPNVPKSLKLCTGMRVMTIVNSYDYKNGNLGTIIEINKNSILLRLDNDEKVYVKKHTFELASGGTYTQFPLVHGYAISVHKCQGMTLDAIRVKGPFFAPAQLYTALSRVKSIEGLYLEKPLTKNDLQIDVDALAMTI